MTVSLLLIFKQTEHLLWSAGKLLPTYKKNFIVEEQHLLANTKMYDFCLKNSQFN